MSLPDTLLEAYRRTEYHVERNGQPFVLHVDERSEALQGCHADFGVRCSTFITAYNPRSTPTPEDVNSAAMARLTREVQARGLDALPGVGVDPAGEWEGERSLLVLGLDVPAALALARAYGQNAVLCAGPDAIPRLVLAHA